MRTNFMFSPNNPLVRLGSWLSVLLLVVTGCKTQQKIAYSPDQLVPKDKALLWEISGNGLKKPSFLYGTIHLIPKERYTIPKSVENALEKTDQMAFEIDMRELTNIFTQFTLISKAFMRDGKRLRDLLSAEDYAYVKSKMSERGLPNIGMLERIKPMFLSMMLGSEGENPMDSKSKMTSVEMEMYRAGRSRKLSSTGLETTASQMEVFDAIPYDQQAKMLLATLRTTEKSSDEYSAMLTLYEQQDIDAMHTLMDGEAEGGLNNYKDILLDRRNKNWIPLMGRIMRQQPTIFAVGAGHLGGTQGVIALLRKEGYRVEPKPLQ